MARQLDDAILNLRTNELEIGTWLLKTEGDAAAVLAADATLLAQREATGWCARRSACCAARFARLDVSSRTLFALIEPGSCFAGTLAELAFAADRTYMLALPDDAGARAEAALDAFNFGALPLVNDQSRLARRFYEEEAPLAAARAAIGTALDADAALALGLVTAAPDDIDWDDEIRIAHRGARRDVARRAHRPGGEPALRRQGEHGDAHLRPPHRLAELDLPAARTRSAPRARSRSTAPARRRASTSIASERADEHFETHTMAIDYSQKIPNNVNLADDRTLQRALEQWQPNFINWWDDIGPEGSTNHDVYLRTAISVDPQGWAHFDYVKMRDYRWGIFLNPADAERKIDFGDHKGEKAWQDVPGEHRANLRRIIVTQGDTEPASVEQQRHLGLTAPSLYDLRNLFQVNVEEGRHLWAMVYLLHKLLRPRRPRGGRGAARAPLGRRRTTRASSAPSTRRRPTGWRSSCSPTSPTATASSSSPRWPRAASIRWRARPSSC